ncbi:hypothetical protein [Leptospira yanagawae]|uniref:hypothetical protein n=1 Tax=Leptospira yanagawae TaxID=293069 RepID=UPI000587B36D|nr:hypothetical protein [Leptospira yanagawae]
METNVKKSKRPTWISATGIIGIIFSIIGLYAGVEDLFTPQIIDKQKEIFENFETKTKEPNKKNVINNNIKKATSDLFSSFNEMIEKPIWYEKWMIYTGVMTPLVLNISLLYICINLLSLKSSAVVMFY